MNTEYYMIHTFVLICLIREFDIHLILCIHSNKVLSFLLFISSPSSDIMLNIIHTKNDTLSPNESLVFFFTYVITYITISTFISTTYTHGDLSLQPWMEQHFEFGSLQSKVSSQNMFEMHPIILNYKQ